MNSEHIQTEHVKQYLLGTLPEREASAIEERYFTDSSFFSQLRAAEIELIGAYLDKNLSPEEHAQFESRYLAVPALREMIERVHTQRATSVPAPSRRLWLVLASSIAVVVIAAMFLRKGQPPQQAQSHPTVNGITLFLEPGVTMGPTSQAKLLKIPRVAKPVSLIAELPGETSSADYIVRLKKVEANRNEPVLWSSSPIPSTPRPGGQQVAVTLESSFFSPGDYILELETHGKLRETYVFTTITSSQ